MNVAISTAREYVNMPMAGAEFSTFSTFQATMNDVLDRVETYEAERSMPVDFRDTWTSAKARLVAVGLTLPDNPMKASFLASAMELSTWSAAETVFMLRAAFEAAARMGDTVRPGR